MFPSLTAPIPPNNGQLTSPPPNCCQQQVLPGSYSFAATGTYQNAANVNTAYSQLCYQQVSSPLPPPSQQSAVIQQSSNCFAINQSCFPPRALLPTNAPLYGTAGIASRVQTGYSGFKANNAVAHANAPCHSQQQYYQPTGFMPLPPVVTTTAPNPQQMLLISPQPAPLQPAVIPIQLSQPPSNPINTHPPPYIQQSIPLQNMSSFNSVGVRFAVGGGQNASCAPLGVPATYGNNIRTSLNYNYVTQQPLGLTGFNGRVQQNVNRLHYRPYHPPAALTNQQQFLQPPPNRLIVGSAVAPRFQPTIMPPPIPSHQPPAAILQMPTLAIRPVFARPTLNNAASQQNCHVQQNLPHNRTALMQFGQAAQAVSTSPGVYNRSQTYQCASPEYITVSPSLPYNEEYLANEMGECVICLEDMGSGDLIARLPCLCIYHKPCIDEWLYRKNTCPVHPPCDE